MIVPLTQQGRNGTASPNTGPFSCDSRRWSWVTLVFDWYPKKNIVDKLEWDIISDQFVLLREALLKIKN